jgi:hypothetical protein
MVESNKCVDGGCVLVIQPEFGNVLGCRRGFAEEMSDLPADSSRVSQDAVTDGRDEETQEGDVLCMAKVVPTPDVRVEGVHDGGGLGWRVTDASNVLL